MFLRTNARSAPTLSSFECWNQQISHVMNVVLFRWRVIMNPSLVAHLGWCGYINKQASLTNYLSSLSFFVCVKQFASVARKLSMENEHSESVFMQEEDKDLFSYHNIGMKPNLSRFWAVGGSESGPRNMPRVTYNFLGKHPPGSRYVVMVARINV